MARKKTRWWVDISPLSEEQQKAIQDQLAEAKKEAPEKEAPKKVMDGAIKQLLDIGVGEKSGPANKDGPLIPDFSFKKK